MIVKSIPSGVVLQNNKCEILYCNSMAATILGLTEEQLVGKTSYDPDWSCFKEDGSSLGIEDMPITIVLRDKKPVNGFLMGVKKPNKSTAWISVNAEPIFETDSNSPDYVVISYNDISDLKTKEKKLKASNEELERFAYVASHDLREPLRKIASFGERLNRKYASELQGDGAEYLKRMINATGRMQVFIDDLLAFSRFSRNITESKPVNLNEILRGVLVDLEAQIEGSKAVIKIDNLPEIMGVRSQLSQLFQNLISNALKFKKPNNISHIDIIYTEQPNIHEIRIQDNGIGFEEADAESIFELFKRLNGRSAYEGTGIGLAICKRIVENHDGIIVAHAVAGEGATFILYFPKINSL